MDDDDSDDDFLPSNSVLADIMPEQNWNIQDLADVVGKSASLNLGTEEPSFALVRTHRILMVCFIRILLHRT